MNFILTLLKYDGYFKKMLEALQTKEKTDPQKLEEYKKDVRHKYVTLVSHHYPEYFKTVKCPPIVLFYKGNLKLIDEGLPMEYSVLESGKRFISTVNPIKQNERIVFDYIVCVNVRRTWIRCLSISKVKVFL